jgi:serine protease AprX
MVTTQEPAFEEWVLLAFADPGDPAPWRTVLERINTRFRHLFPADSFETDASGRPRWEQRATRARRRLAEEGLAQRIGSRWSLTAEGTTRAAELASRSTGTANTPPQRPKSPLVMPSVVAQPLLHERERARIGFPTGHTDLMHVVLELNLRHPRGVTGAYDELCRLWNQLSGPVGSVQQLSESYCSGELTMVQIEELVALDRERDSRDERALHRIWPDFPIQTLITDSARTIKADAGRRAFACRGDGIVWAVLDTGIDASHPHFQTYRTLVDPQVVDLHRDFTSAGQQGKPSPLTDEKGHGTHVAGIIAGGLPPDWPHDDPARLHAAREEYAPDGLGLPQQVQQKISDPTVLSGIAPATKLVSLKVVESDSGTLTDRVSRLIAALYYIRQVNASSGRVMRIHGVNISIGHEFDPKWYACGHTPVCEEVDKLVRSGVVVVVAAGNTGYGTLDARVRDTDVGLQMTINDPGNAARAITVGSTHRQQPHRYGVSYFSSKGPTGDGRIKPDLLAPGERILSCATGANLAGAGGAQQPGCAVYVEDTGTSMAAPHVSGAIAAFLSVYSEFIGQPERIKDVFMSTATSLGREQYFQGAGLVDLLRALQAR